MKIVVLDGYTTTGEDLNWSEFEKLGDFVYYDRTTPDEVIARAKDADIVIDNKVLLGISVSCLRALTSWIPTMREKEVYLYAIFPIIRANRLRSLRLR